jgi:hypothetical protein
MEQKDLKDVYETPLAQVRGVFLCENVTVVQSPVKGRGGVEPWVEEDVEVVPDNSDEGILPLW